MDSACKAPWVPESASMDGFGRPGVDYRNDVRYAQPSSGSVDVCEPTIIKDTAISGKEPVLSCLVSLVSWLLFASGG